MLRYTATLILRRKMSQMVCSEIGSNLQSVLERIKIAYEKIPASNRSPNLPRLLAVSKTKPIEDIIAAYSAGQRHFGENYFQELEQKSTNSEILANCNEICWHFIGNLQKNKISKIVKIPNLFLIESVDSEKLALMLENSVGKIKSGPVEAVEPVEPLKISVPFEPLKIFVQVNTSGEEQKFGIDPGAAINLAEKIMNEMKNLKFVGFMTIGALEQSLDSTEENQDFRCLADLRKKFCIEKNLDLNSIELSMGMSSDFEQAILMGSTNVRVGSTIFGARPSKN